MSDTNDPFADRPYVPPVNRDDADDAPSASDTPSPERPATPAAPPVPSASSDEQPTPEQPTTEQPATPAAEAPAQPVSPSAPQPPPAEPTAPVAENPTEPVPVTPEEPTISYQREEPTEQFTHRYESAGAYAGATAAAATSTQQLPAFPPADGSGGAGDSGASTETAAAAPRRKRGKVAAAATSIILLGAASGVGGAYAYDQIHDDGNGPVVSSLNNDNSSSKVPAGAVEKVAQTVLPSVVQINVKGSSEAGSGTGIIISSDGQILTNNHVVEAGADGGSITVSFNDGTITSATILGRDPVTDLAVIKAKDKSGLKPAVLGNSSDLKVGQEVVAIGSPFGLESTVTSGIVSALNRPVSSSDGSGTDAGSVFPAVQTDAAINPGNSGGPLVDLEGRVIAINSAIRTNGGSDTEQSGSIGLGFAIPIDLAKNVSKHLVKGEKVEHARIGITVTNSVQSDGITTTGAEVKDVTKGGAGEKAGVKKGDVVTAINGTPVASSDGLVAAVRGFQPGEQVTLTLLRDGKKQEVKVTLDSDGGNLGS